MKRHLVVALYNENPKWINDALATGAVDRVFVYNKGPREVDFSDERVVVVKAPNVGREGETFLRHIVEQWDHLPDALWFSQGDPFEHSPDFVGLLGAVESYGSQPFWSMSQCFKRSLSIPPISAVDLNDAYNVGGLRCSSYFIRDMQLVGHCAFLDHGTRIIMGDFRGKYRTNDAFGYLSLRLGISRPGPITELAYGACMYVSGACIRRHPRWVYEEAKKFLLETDPQGSFQGYVLERFWPYLLSGRSFDSITDCYRQSLFGAPLAVWCRSRKRVWLKVPHWGEVIEDANTVVCFYDGVRVRHFVGIDVVGRDIKSAQCDSLAAADAFLSGSSPASWASRVLGRP